MRRLFFWNEKATPVDDLIAGVLVEMQQYGPESSEYLKMMSYLERLHALKTKNRRQPMSRDTLAIVIGNLAGILIIVAYEQKHVMTSKGFMQLVRPERPK